MDADKKHLTGIRKRQQIAQANKTMFMWVIGAAVLISFCIVALQFMFKQALFNGEIIGAKSLANTTLQQNLDSSTDLQNNVNALIGNSDLSAARLNDNESNLRVILDALPAKNDVAAFAASMQQTILSGSGVFIDGLNVPSETSTTEEFESAPPLVAEPQEQVFNAVIQGNFNQVNNALRDIQRTIRPISIKNMSVQGNDKSLRVTLEGITYYQPAKTVNIQTKTIKP
jgi:Tfp pilus assembly protein PilO